MRTIIIAEAGVNHNGSLVLAKQLIDVAADAGVDYVKFQTFKAENLVTTTAEKATYQQKNASNSQETQFEMLKKLELSEDDHFTLMAYANEKGVKFFSTAFDLESLDFLASLKLGFWKIPSGEITNYPYLKKIASYSEPIILSTGMSSIQEIQDAVHVLCAYGAKKEEITILHCNTEYPTPMEDVNLRAMQLIATTFGVQIGYSDHTLGIEVPIAAVALGATIIEKHFTLDKTLEGPDHQASLLPEELKSMVIAIRNIEQAVGNCVKKESSSEQKNKAIARKSLVAACAIAKGECFTEKNMTVKRPGTGISPMQWNEMLGAVAQKEYNPGDLIER